MSAKWRNMWWATKSTARERTRTELSNNKKSKKRKKYLLFHEFRHAPRKCSKKTNTHRTLSKASTSMIVAKSFLEDEEEQYDGLESMRIHLFCSLAIGYFCWKECVWWNRLALNSMNLLERMMAHWMERSILNARVIMVDLWEERTWKVFYIVSAFISSWWLPSWWFWQWFWGWWWNLINYSKLLDCFVWIIFICSIYIEQQ